MVGFMDRKNIVWSEYDDENLRSIYSFLYNNFPVEFERLNDSRIISIALSFYKESLEKEFYDL